MAERVVKVKLSAHVAEYKRGMLEAANATRTVGTEAEKLAQYRDAFRAVGAAGVAMGSALALGIGIAVKKAAEFDQAMSNVQAATHETAENMDALRKAALEAGASTVFSATESANAIEELAKAGISTADILGGGLKGALDLAAAGGLGVAEAAGIAATTMQQFQLTGDKASHVADLLAAGAGKAMGDVTDLSGALKQSGLVANQFGLSVEETVGTLSAFASAGLLGSDAGTSFRTMLLRLANPTGEAADKMSELGINAYDASGQFVGMEAFAGQLTTGLKGLTQEQQNAALAIMFGQDAIRGANVLLQNGETGIRNWTKAVDDQGYAAETASIRLDNLMGDLEALQGAMDTALITTGGTANDTLRGVVQTLTALVDVYNELPEGAQGTALAIAAGASAVGLLGGATLLAVPQVAAFKDGMRTLNLTMGGTAGIAAGVGLAIGGLMTAVTVLAQKHAEARAKAQGYADAITQGGDAVRNFRIENLQAEQSFLWISRGSAADAAEKFGISLSELEAAIAGGKDELAAMDDVIKAGRGDTDALMRVMEEFGLTAVEASSATTMVAEAVESESKANSEGARILAQKKKATEDATKADEDAEAGLRGVASSAQAATFEVDEVARAIKGFAEAAYASRDAARNYEQAIDDLEESIKENGKTLDITTQAGRDNEQAVDDLAAAVKRHAGEVVSQTGDQEKANGILAEGRQKLIEMLGQFGITGQAAESYADELGLIPGNVSTSVQLFGIQDAENRLAWLVRNRTAAISVAVSETRTRDGAASGGYSTGGAVFGAGSDTSDNIPAWLSPGEHVLTAREVRAAGGHAAIYRLRLALMGGRAPRFASGGAVTKASADQEVKNAQARKDREQREYDAARRARDATKKGSDARATTQKALDEATRQLNDAKRDLSSAKSAAASVRSGFRSEYTDWATGQRRGENHAAGMNGQGLSLVDQLLDIAAGTGGKAGSKLRDQALKSEKAYLSLEKAADRASTMVERARDKLSELKDASAAMASRVSDAVRSYFSIGDLKHPEVKTQKSMTVDGQTYSWYETDAASTKPTAKSILSGTRAAASRIKGFADKLGKLAKKGLNAALLEEIAMLGVEAGEPIADALLSATSPEISQINKAYTDIGKYSDKAGTSVADANFKPLIEKAEAQVKATEKASTDIQKKLKTETDRIIGAITGALQSGSKKATGGPIVGPGTGTSDDVPIWASNGEHMWTAAEVRAAGGHGAVARMRRGVLVPTSPRFAYAQGGPVGSVSAESRAEYVRPEKEVIQLVVNGRVLAETVREHDRSLR